MFLVPRFGSRDGDWLSRRRKGLGATIASKRGLLRGGRERERERDGKEQQCSQIQLGTERGEGKVLTITLYQTRLIPWNIYFFPSSFDKHVIRNRSMTSK